MPLPTYLMSNFPSVRPSLNLQFDSQPTPEDMTSHLASVGATFSRASIGTYTDANGLIQEASAGQARPNYSTAGVHEGLLIEESRVNLVKSSEDFSVEWTGASAGAGSGAVVTVNQAIAPDGTASADKIFFDAGGTTSSDRSQLTSNTVSVTLGNTYTSFIYLKGDSGGEIIDIRHANGTTFTSFTLTTEWQKCVVTETVSTSSASRPLNLRCVGNNQQTATVYAWGAQMEEGSFPTSYIPTIPTFSSRASTATYFDSSGVLQTASIDEARTDHKYIDGQWVEAGLLLEGASTNLVTNSEDLNTFTKTNTTVTSNQINGLDGTLTADELTESSDAIAQNHRLSFTTPSLTSGNDYTMSVFAKNNGRDYLQLTFNSSDFSVTQYATFNLSTGVIENAVDGTAQMQDVGNGWYRCSFTSDCTSSGASTIFFILSDTASGRDPSYIGDGTSGVYLWGAQLEQQSQVTSYIPTSGSSATRSADVYSTATKTRSADVCYIDGTAFTDFYNQEQGTWFLNTSVAPSGGGGGLLFPHNTSNPTGTRTVAIYKSASNNNIDFAFGGSYVGNVITTDEYDIDAFNKFAISIIEGDVDIYSNGSSAYSASRSISENLNKVFIGAWLDGALPLNASMKKLIYFPRKLDNNELIKLTQ